jgi:hypothetical protein
LSPTGRVALAAAPFASIVASLLAGSSAAATNSEKPTLDGAGATEQFAGNADDRARGEGSNPFGGGTFEVPGGTRAGAGSFNSAAADFTLAPTAGSGAYGGRTGTARETPAASHAQRFVFS